MTLEEDEDIGLNPSLSASRHHTLTRCAETATVIPIIILLLPVYTLIQVGAAAIAAGRIYRILRDRFHQRTLLEVCSPSQNWADGTPRR
jgi:hypothetical protein